CPASAGGVADRDLGEAAEPRPAGVRALIEQRPLVALPEDAREIARDLGREAPGAIEDRDDARAIGAGLRRREVAVRELAAGGPEGVLVARSVRYGAREREEGRLVHPAVAPEELRGDAPPAPGFDRRRRSAPFPDRTSRDLLEPPRVADVGLGEVDL